MRIIAPSELGGHNDTNKSAECVYWSLLLNTWYFRSVVLNGTFFVVRVRYWLDSFLKWSEDFSLHFRAKATDELFCSIIKRFVNDAAHPNKLAHFFINKLTHFFSLLICSFQLSTTQPPHQAPASDTSSQHHSKEPKTNGQEDNQREKSFQAMKCSLRWTCHQRLKMWQMFGLIAWQRSGG